MLVFSNFSAFRFMALMVWTRVGHANLGFLLQHYNSSVRLGLAAGLLVFLQG
jgi:predicted oxidoreductase (fatty acid repression mutant protein)